MREKAFQCTFLLCNKEKGSMDLKKSAPAFKWSQLHKGNFFYVALAPIYLFIIFMFVIFTVWLWNCPFLLCFASPSWRIRCGCCQAVYREFEGNSFGSTSSIE